MRLKVKEYRRVESVPGSFYVEPSSPLSQAFNPPMDNYTARYENQWSAGHKFSGTPVMVLAPRWKTQSHYNEQFTEAIWAHPVLCSPAAIPLIVAPRA